MFKRLLVLLGLAAPLVATVAEAAGNNPRAIFETSAGPITIELFADRAPKTVAQIKRLIKEGFYDGVVFHRVVKGFVIQGGGFDKNLREKPDQPNLPNEAANGLKNLAGTLSMARTSAPHSASSQFFINLVDNPMLDYRSATQMGYGYAVFGKVVAGMEVVQSIGQLKVGPGGPFPDEVPQPLVTIQKARLL